MKLLSRSICFALVACIGLTVVGKKQTALGAQERKRIDSFYEAADYHDQTLLLKILQFTAPYPGSYQATSLQTNGHAFTATIVPDWAVQGSASAMLDSALIDQIRLMLARLHLPLAERHLEPQPDQLHSALVFYDGNAYRRLNFNGPIPAEVDAIVRLLKTELIAAAKLEFEALMAHGELLRETYGDWKNRDGLTVPNSSRMSGFEGRQGLLLGLLGQRKTTSAAQPVAVSIYHAIVLYPMGANVTGGGHGRNWSDDPVSRNGVTWTLPNSAGSFAENTSQRELELEHNAIDETVQIDGKTYYLSQGNLFIIRMSEDWKPAVTQLSQQLREDASEQIVLDRFKSITGNETSIQPLVLLKQ